MHKWYIKLKCIWTTYKYKCLYYDNLNELLTINVNKVNKAKVKNIKLSKVVYDDWW